MLTKIKEIKGIPEETIMILESALHSLKDYTMKSIDSQIDILLQIQKEMEQKVGTIKNLYNKRFENHLQLLVDEIKELPKLIEFYQENEQKSIDAKKRIEAVVEKGNTLFSQPGMKEALEFKNKIIKKYI